MNAQTVLVTGASGFIGRALIADLARRGFSIRAAARDPIAPAARVEPINLPDLATAFDAAPLVAGVDAVVHLAGLAHAGADLPESRYIAINTEATRRLAIAARDAGVANFILMSSVRAQSGPSSAAVLTEASPPVRTDAYGRSKLAAETAMEEVFAGSATRTVCLRPVLVYGPGVKGNMAALMRLARARLPLPLGGLTGKRSLLGVANLSSAVAHALDASPPSGVYLVADDGALTAPDIIAALRTGAGRQAGLIPAPQWAIRAALTALGRGSAAERLFGDLVVDAAKLKATGWRPVEATKPALAALMRAECRH